METMTKIWRKKEWELSKEKDICINIAPGIRVNQTYINKENEKDSKLKKEKTKKNESNT